MTNSFPIVAPEALEPGNWYWVCCPIRYGGNPFIIEVTSTEFRSPYNLDGRAFGCCESIFNTMVAHDAEFRGPIPDPWVRESPGSKGKS
jgi:hypothetical protein